MAQNQTQFFSSLKEKSNAYGHSDTTAIIYHFFWVFWLTNTSLWRALNSLGD